jgi:Ca-activated chloride channel homolog
LAPRGRGKLASAASSIALCVLRVFVLTALSSPLNARPPQQDTSKQTRAQRKKLPKPRELDAGVIWHRDPGTGELTSITAGAGTANPAVAPPSGHAIRVTSQIVPVTCGIFDADGAAIPDLKRSDFRIYEDGVEQRLAYFDVSTAPASVALVVDASPSVLRDSDEMKRAALSLVEGLAPADQVSVVDFSAHTYLQLDFSSDREQIRRGIDRVDVRQLLGDVGGSNIYEAVYLSAAKVFLGGREGRKSIVLLTDGQDSGLGLTLDPATAAPKPGQPNNRLTFEDVVRSLAAADIQIFAVSTENRPKIMTPEWLAAHKESSLLISDAARSAVPVYTLYLAELVRRTGGQLYFLRDSSSLADIFRRIAQRISAEYTLGYYPAESSSNHAGWHRLRVEVVGHPGATIVHRAAYYVPATAE